MKEVYLVKWSSGEYDYFTVENKETVFVSLLSAEKAKKEIEDYHKIEYPFPIDYCEEHSYNYNDVSDEDFALVIEWETRKTENYNFNRAWIETLTLEE